MEIRLKRKCVRKCSDLRVIKGHYSSNYDLPGKVGDPVK
jgi:hypothetical protein